MTAPDASVTTPMTVPVACAKSGAAQANPSAAPMAADLRNLHIAWSPSELPCPFLGPPFHDDLLVHVELDSVSSLRMQIAEEAAFPPGKREERHRCRHTDVDADVAGPHLVAELPRRSAARREDTSHISERRRV